MKHVLFGIFFAPLILLGSIAIAQGDADDEVDYPHLDVPVTTDLTNLSSLAEQRHVPILLMFSSDDCDYCERLEEDVIRPMMLSGDFDRRAIFRKVMIDNAGQFTNFAGAPSYAEDFAYQRNVDVTPTLMFVDANGKELAPKVVGYQMSGLYMAYLEAAINASRQSINTQEKNRQKSQQESQ